MSKIWTQEEEANRLRERFDALKSEKGIGQAEFARVNNVPGGPSLLSQHIKNRRPINLEAATSYAKGFGCSIGEISPRLAKEVLDASNAYPSDASNTSPALMGVIRIPLISYVQAGVWTEVVDNFHPGDAEDWLMTDLKLSVHAFALEIKGDSMLPEFKPGDRVIIDPDVAPLPGDFVAAKNGEDEATFKKYRPRGSDAQGNAVFELVPLNDDFPSIRSDLQPIKIVGTMVEHRKYRRAR